MRTPTDRSRILTALALAIACCAALTLLGVKREAFTSIKGDEGTYLAMIESLALDGDLEFSEPDIERTESASEIGRKYLILHRVGDQLFYSKPAIYPLLAAPFYRLAGSWGPFLFNCLVLGASLWIAWLYLLRFGRPQAATTVVTFAGAGVLLAYTAWTMSEALQVGCALAGTALSIGMLGRGSAKDGNEHPIFRARIAPYLGGALLGLVVAMRITHALVAVAVIGALVVSRRWRPAAVASIALAATVMVSLGVNQLALEAARPYKTERATFDPGSGYPGSTSNPQVLRRFDRALATVRIPTHVRPRVSLYAGFYFLLGRHSGLLIYLPAALILLLTALRKPDRISLTLLAGAAGLTAVYLLWLPHNYFGGGAAVGNRYFLTAYPLLLFAPTRAPRLRWQLSAWLVAALAFGSALTSVSRVHAEAPTSQSHVHAGLFRLLPYESVASDLEGNVERFWLEEWELVRFSDPHAKVSAWSFTLETGKEPAEIEIANTRTDGLMRFLLLSNAENLELVYEDWGKTERFALSRPMADRGIVEIEPSPAWRSHQFWFSWMRDTRFQARVFRLSIETPDGSPARADVSYLGPTDLDLDIFRHRVLNSSVPATAEVGTSSEVSLRVRNKSTEAWSSERVLPVLLSYRLIDVADAGYRFEGPRMTIGTIEPRGILAQSLLVDWPAQPGTYRLEVDLLVEGVAWFSRRVGQPLVSQEVEVGPLGEAPEN